MHDSRAVFLVAPDKIMCVKCMWENPSKEDRAHAKISEFKTTDLDIKVNDIVACEVSVRHGVGIFQVVEVNVDIDLRSDISLPWVVAKIDQDAHKANVENEAKLTTALRRGQQKRLAEELKKDMLGGIEDDVAKITFG